ncbi:hypothetical protein BN1708_020150, partial [Verticillium longisporum]
APVVSPRAHHLPRLAH